MPYVQQDIRDEIDAGRAPENVGELTYYVFVATLRYLNSAPEKFQHFAEAIAALDCAKEEIRRRRLNPYEDHKRQTEGDIVVCAPVNH